MNVTLSPAVVFGSRTLAEIAANLPGATRVFRRHKLDFCCGGQVMLADAAAGRGLELDDLVSELQVLGSPRGEPDVSATTEALIDRIERRYHAAHRQELPELIRLARRVEAVHKANAAVPRGMATLLEQIAGELEAHMMKEETVLFPLMRQGAQPMIRQPIAVMLAEHDGHAAHLRELLELTEDFTPPDDACTTWRALYAGGAKFAEDLTEHVHLENNVLFPRFTG